MAITITLTNTNENPFVLGGGKIDTTVISPTGLTTPDTPYLEYVSDSQTITDGTVIVPAWKKFQFFAIPAGTIVTLETEISDEAIYYANLEIEGLNVVVSENPITKVTVTFDKTTAAISGTGTSAISATTTPAGQTVAWASSDEDVATVSNGTVTGVAPGTCVITGSIDVNGAKASATCEVTVS